MEESQQADKLHKSVWSFLNQETSQAPESHPKTQFRSGACF